MPIYLEIKFYYRYQTVIIMLKVLSCKVISYLYLQHWLLHFCLPSFIGV